MKKKRHRGLTRRQQRVVQNKLANMTDVEAVRKAGYSEKTALHMAHKIVDNPHVQNVLQSLIQTRFPPEYVTDKLDEGLNAMKIMFHGNKKLMIPDYAERGKSLERVVEWGGYIAKRVNIADGAAVNIENVNVLQVTQAHERIVELTERIRARAKEAHKEKK